MCKLAHASFKEPGQPVVKGPARVAVYIISAEDLVCSFAGKRHLDLFRGNIANKIQRYCRGVRKGLIHMILYLFKASPILLGADHLAVIILADGF